MMKRACLFLLAGLFILQLSSFNIDSAHIGPMCLASSVCLLRRRLRLLGVFLAGAAWFAAATFGVVEKRIAPEFVGDSLLVEVRIVDFPLRKGRTVTFVAEPLNEARLPARLRLTWFDPPVDLQFGDSWGLELRLQRPRGSSNAGGFDIEGWLTREQIGAVGYVVDGPRNHLLAAGDLSDVDVFRSRFVNRVTELVPTADNAAVLAAIVVGARHLIKPAQWDQYARTGTSHLMAISGLHIGLAAAGGYFLACVLAAIFAIRGNHHQAAVAASVIVALLYALISGLAVPAQRASLMIVLFAVALLRRRLARPPEILALAAAALAIADPLVTMAAGYRLSFGAVLILFWMSRRLRRRLCSPTGRFLRALREMSTAQLLLLLGLLPMTSVIFARSTLAAPVVNLFAVPLFSVVTVPLALTGLILDGPLHVAGDVSLRVAAWSIGVINQLIASVAAFPLATRELPGLSGFGWLYAAGPAFWVVAPRGWPGRYLAWLLFTALLLYVPPRTAPGCASIEVLDVGHGLAIVVETQGSVLLFDTGPSYRDEHSAAESIVRPFLQSRGIRHLDQLVVSHSDLDHSGGVTLLAETTSIGELLTGEHLALPNLRQRPCRAGDGWQRDGVDFQILHPAAQSTLVGNDTSCVLQISAGRRRVLLTGDIEQQAERQLLQANTVSQVDVVIVPHHGSRTSSTQAFVDTLRPRFAIVSTNFGNRWGFPKVDIVERWHAAGAEVFVTATSGAVGFSLCAGDDSVMLRQNRWEQRRIWHE